jgi:hypothetical protein
MCGRYRLTRRRLMEIEDHYRVDDVSDLDMWQRQFNKSRWIIPAE